MSSELEEVLDILGEKFELFIDWSQQNIQPYVQDLMHRVVQYKLVTNIIGCSVMVLILIVGIVFFVHSIKRIDSNDYIEVSYVAGFIFGIIMIMFAIILLPMTINNIIQCCYLPEMVFIEEIKALM